MTATSTFTHLLSSEIEIQCCFTSTETIRIIRDGEPRTTTSTFTQLLRSELKKAKQSYHCMLDETSFEKKKKEKKTHTLVEFTLCTLYLHACQVRVTVGDRFCTYVTHFER